MKNYYHAFNKQDIINFIKNVVLDGDDPMKTEREHFVETELMVNYPNASQSIIDMIKKELKIKH